MYADSVLSNVIRQLKTGQNLCMQVTLDATLAPAGAVAKVISIPNTASIVRIYPTQKVMVGLTELPGAAATTATFVVGSLVKASEWATFALDIGLSRTLQLTTASTAVVDIEIY